MGHNWGKTWITSFFRFFARRNRWIAAFLPIVLGVPRFAAAWEVEVDGPGHGLDQVHATALDSQGNVIAAGYLTNRAGSTDFAVIKFSGVTGSELWRAVLSGTTTAFGSQARAVAVDANDDVAVAGYIANVHQVIDYSLLKQDFAVVKLSGLDGQVLWRQEIAGSLNPFVANNDPALAIALDGNGNVFAGGQITTNGVTYGDWAVLKFDGMSGTELWRQLINGSGNVDDAVNALVADADSNIIAAGYLVETGDGEDLTVIKLDGQSGSEIWRSETHGTLTLQAQALSIALDSSGNIIAGGYVDNNDTSLDFTVVKLEPIGGGKLWQTQINGNANSFDLAQSVAVDANDNVLAAGQIRNRSEYFADFSTVKLDGATGTELWRSQIQGRATAAARMTTADANGGVVTVGEITNPRPGSGASFEVIRLDGSTGNEVWRVEDNGTHTGNEVSSASAVAIDSDGNVIAAGSAVNAGTSADWAVLKVHSDGTAF